MIGTEIDLSKLILEILDEVRIAASIEASFSALLEQIGPANETPDGVHLPMRIEAFPGGRWYRDLGESLGQLGLHIATTPGNVAQMATLSEVDAPEFHQEAAASVDQILVAHDEGVENAIRVVGGFEDQAMGEIWRSLSSAPRSLRRRKEQIGI